MKIASYNSRFNIVIAISQKFPERTCPRTSDGEFMHVYVLGDERVTTAKLK